MCYYRIMNRLDADMIKEDVIRNMTNLQEDEKNTISERICHIADVMDVNYCANRGSHSMGGYVLCFTDVLSYARWIGKIYELYHINPELAEYEDVIFESAKNNIVWKEELFMLSSDDSITVHYFLKNELRYQEWNSCC